jgi:hypothetical protein
MFVWGVACQLLTFELVFDCQISLCPANDTVLACHRRGPCGHPTPPRFSVGLRTAHCRAHRRGPAKDADLGLVVEAVEEGTIDESFMSSSERVAVTSVSAVPTRSREPIGGRRCE